MLPAVSDLVSRRPRGFVVHAALIAACAVSLAPGAFAAAGDAPVKSSAKPSSKKTPLLTREELRACMARQSKMHQDGDELVQVKAKLDAEKTELVQSAVTLKEKLASLDRTNEEQVNSYVAANNDRDKRIDGYEQNSDSYNTRVQALEDARAAYKTDCENRRFDEKDEIAIKKGK